MKNQAKIEIKAKKVHNSSNSKFISYIQIFNKTLFVAIILIVGYFVASTNDFSIKGFILRDLKMQLSEIQDINKETELKVAVLESYENINKRAREMKMVKVDKIDYIDVVEGTVAKR